jgi:uncharacterized membrane protein
VKGWRLQELLELNRYAHDFTAAMWVCGSILIWLICREANRTAAPGEVVQVLRRLAGGIGLITVPSLVIALASGGVRAATFTRYEYAGEITSSLITMLVVKHVIFAMLIAWGIWVHVRSRRLGSVPRGPC